VRRIPAQARRAVVIRACVRPYRDRAWTHRREGRARCTLTRARCTRAGRPHPRDRLRALARVRAFARVDRLRRTIRMILAGPCGRRSASTGCSSLRLPCSRSRRRPVAYAAHLHVEAAASRGSCASCAAAVLRFTLAAVSPTTPPSASVTPNWLAHCVPALCCASVPASMSMLLPRTVRWSPADRSEPFISAPRAASW
jgi:hypothetical protein